MPDPTIAPFTWATDTNYTNGPTGIPGTATKVAPSAGEIAEGALPQAKLPAQEYNYVLNVTTAWVERLEEERDRLSGYIGGLTGADEWAYPSARIRSTIFLPHMVILPETEVPTIDAWEWERDPQNVDFALKPRSNGVYAWIQPRAHLPAGAILNSLQVFGFFSNAATTFQVTRHTVTINIGLASRVGSAALETSAAVTTAGVQEVGLSSINSGAGVEIGRTSGAAEIIDIFRLTTNTSNTSDTIYAVSMGWEDPGPRNY